MTAILREAVLEHAARFKSVKCALFTTFTFAPDFFEKNVLPLVFNIEPGTDARVKYQVNQHLSKTNIAVFHDGSVRVEGGRDYRYQAKGIWLQDRWFHPKNMIIAGEVDGQPQILVSAASANLNLTAWGNNEESFGFLWIKSRSQQPWEALYEFCKYLRDNHGGDKVPALTDIIDCLKSMPGDYVRDKDDAELYFSSIMTSGRRGFPEFLNEEAANSRERLRVFSPYWAGDIPGLAERFKAERVELVPAFKVSGSGDNAVGHYGLTAKQLEALHNYKNALEYPELFSLIKVPVSGDGYRFRHAKAYVLTSRTGDKARIGVGSCNFTAAGLKGKDGNAESMIVFTVTEDEAAELLKDGSSLRSRDLENTPSPDEGPPDRPPFEIEVSLDWQKKEYFVDFKWRGDYTPAQCGLKLPGIDGVVPLSLPKARFNRLLQGTDKMKRTFRVEYPDKETGAAAHFDGLIFEINLLSSQRDYLPRLSIFEIFESWMHHDDHIIEKKASEAEETGQEALASAPPPQALPADFGFYDIYRGFFNIAAKLKADDTQANVDYVFTARPDSLYKLVESIDTAPLDLATKFIILKECSILLKRVRTGKPDPSFKALLNPKLAAARAALFAELKNNPQDMERIGGKTPAEAVKWIEDQLEEAWKSDV